MQSVTPIPNESIQTTKSCARNRMLKSNTLHYERSNNYVKSSKHVLSHQSQCTSHNSYDAWTNTVPGCPPVITAWNFTTKRSPLHDQLAQGKAHSEHNTLAYWSNKYGGRRLKHVCTMVLRWRIRDMRLQHVSALPSCNGRAPKIAATALTTPSLSMSKWQPV